MDTNQDMSNDQGAPMESRTTVMNGVSVELDDTNDLNIRLRVLDISGRQVFECGVDNGPRPDVSTVFPIPEALKAAPLDPLALPNDPEALKQIITDVDFKLVNCQMVAAAEFTRLAKEYNKVNHSFQRAQRNRSDAQEKFEQRTQELNRRWQEEVSAHARTRREYDEALQAVLNENKALQTQIAGSSRTISGGNGTRDQRKTSTRRIEDASTPHMQPTFGQSSNIQPKSSHPVHIQATETQPTSPTEKLIVVRRKARQVKFEVEVGLRVGQTRILWEYTARYRELKQEFDFLRFRIKPLGTKHNVLGKHREDTMDPYSSESSIHNIKRLRTEGSYTEGEGAIRRSERDLMAELGLDISKLDNDASELLKWIEVNGDGDAEMNDNN